MPASREPSDLSGPNPFDTGAGTPTPPAAADTEDVQGFMLGYCSACLHLHSQTDPKCNLRCGHGAIAPYSSPSTY